MNEVLGVDGLNVSYGPLRVVRDATLTVAGSEKVALLGANGAGKTTLLLSVAGLVRADSGTVRVAGRGVTTASGARAAGLACVPDDRALFPSLTPRQHFALVRGVSLPAAVRRAVEWFPALTRIVDRPAGLLSGGEQQMVALARALLGSPRVLLIDEMSMGLAPIVVRSLLECLDQVVDETGCGILLVEQQVHLARSWADRVLVLRRGVLADSAPSDDEDVERHYLGPLDHGT